jgi:hypothetical protein
MRVKINSGSRFRESNVRVSERENKQWRKKSKDIKEPFSKLVGLRAWSLERQHQH